ncbi:MAG: beta-aspartyl-peptidase [Candidatus Aminicenantes bacterium]|nr:beta-aspartyl-peptidase [Candidatus Aminicenantes bacterium]
MITLIEGGEVYTPVPLGKKDLLILDTKIGAVYSPGDITITGLDVHRISAKGRMVVPGFIDNHVHILGGGGEGGPATRAPEIMIENILASGVTTLIGCLGTDGTTRHMESLLAKARGLEIEGVSTYIFTGSYQIPVVTITGSVRSDLILIDKVIGAGEIAISDHRSAQPTFEEFARLAAECRVGGMLGGKAGILHCHLGDGPRKLEMLFRLVADTEIPITQIIPTHCNRSEALLQDAITFINQGGTIDLTANPNPASQDTVGISIAEVVRTCQDRNVPITRITVSSDANGSMPVFDKDGKLIKLTIASQDSLLKNFKYLITETILPVEDALRLFATTPADFYKLESKGKIQSGKDADLIILDRDLNLSDAFHMGKQTVRNGRLCVTGTFS